MSGKRIEHVSPERMTDLPAFEGKKFADEPCPVCETHLAVIGLNRCVLCTAAADVGQEDMAFDPELQDVVNELGSAEIW